MPRIALHNTGAGKWFNPHHIATDSADVAVILVDPDDDWGDMEPSVLRLSLPLQPLFNLYNQPWHRNTLDQLERARTFINPRVYYDDETNIIFRSDDPAKCFAVLFYYLLHYYWGDYERIDTEMRLYRPDWSLDICFPHLFKQTILYPILIQSFHYNL